MNTLIEKQKFPINCRDCISNGGNVGLFKVPYQALV